MLPLQQNARYTKRRFFKDILYFVIFCHIALFLLFFFLYKDTHQNQHFSVNMQNLQSTIVLMPLHKKIPQKLQNKNKSGSKKLHKKIINYESFKKKKKVEKVVKKTVEKKTKIVENKVKKITPKIAEKAVQIQVKKKIAPIAKKASTVLKSEDVKKPVEKKEVLSDKKSLVEKKKIEEKPLKVEDQLLEKKEEPKAVEKPDEQLPVEKIKEEVDLKKEEMNEPEIDLDNVTFVGRHDLDVIQIQELIQSEVAQYWQQPLGIAKTAVCDFSVAVNAKGLADKVTIVGSSGSIANDMCARAALYKVQYPKEVWGKEITIALGQ